MKYLLVNILVGVPNEELETWSEHADCTFFLAAKLHKPKENLFIVKHEPYPILSEEDVQKLELKYSVITKEGGV